MYAAWKDSPGPMNACQHCSVSISLLRRVPSFLNAKRITSYRSTEYRNTTKSLSKSLLYAPSASFTSRARRMRSRNM
ncbi:hypothetical protein COCVIDRAFT_102308 [Bipolaris victoriae FI3]|uniref:Uncharacterized protein n=1 Tax=Bipolaris victoriae (strain FI3) TaxID=930091 RepID=W7END3_BIPV3|nr:hypothetical protein COCVIDRAFT_102308 [Bipolaris victoriae FI3]